MNRLLPLLALLVVIGCDSAAPPTSPEIQYGIIEGTYTLPDGTMAPFSGRATARGAARFGWTQPRFGFGSSNPYPVEDPDAILVSVGFSQIYGRTTPTPGDYQISPTLTGEPVYGSFTITNVPNLNPERVNDPSVARVESPEGAMTLAWRAGNRIEGRFSLTGQPNGVDESVRVSVEGTFDIPVTTPPRD